jgi:hypothetical protein
LGAASALAVLLGMESYFRIKYRDLLWIHVYPQIYLPDDDLGYRYQPHADAEIRIAGIHRRFRINNRGFNGRDFVEEKPPGTYRIAIVGASNTTGIWTNGQGKSFSELLEELLRDSGRRVEVMNFGIDGRFRALHQLRVIDLDVAAYDPDLVLMDIDIPFVNSLFRRDVYKGYVMIYNPETAASRQWCEARVDRVTRHRFMIAGYRASYIVRAAARYYMNHYDTDRSTLLRVFFENRIQAPDLFVLPYSLKRSVEYLQETRDKLAAQGAQLVIFQFLPNPYYQAVTSKYGLSYIELDVPPVPQFVHDRDGHYRFQGHVEIARQLFDRLTDGVMHESN